MNLACQNEWSCITKMQGHYERSPLQMLYRAKSAREHPKPTMATLDALARLRMETLGGESAREGVRIASPQKLLPRIDHRAQLMVHLLGLFSASL